MKKLKYLFLIMLVVTFFSSAPSVNAEVSSVDTELKNVQLKGSTYYNDVITKFKIDGTDLIGIDSFTNQDNILSTYSIFNLNNVFDSSVDKIGFFYYNSSLYYGNTSNVTNGDNSYNTLEVIPPLVRLNNNSCSVKPIGSTSMTSSATYDYSRFFWVECDVLDNSSSYTINVRYIPKTNVSNITVAIQQKIFTWSNIDSQEEIKNAIDNTNDKLDDLNENITNDNIDSSIGNDFFDSFTTNDNGGISAIVTAPLSAIEKMVSGTCTPVKGSYKGKEFSFPCGNTFWADMPDVKNFLNIVLGGFLCYGILAKLYLLIDRLKDPDDDRVDVMKL